MQKNENALNFDGALQSRKNNPSVWTCIEFCECDECRNYKTCRICGLWKGDNGPHDSCMDELLKEEI